MNIPEAKAILKYKLKWGHYPDSLKLKDATNLGIEALRRIEATRLVRKTGTVVPLPGETED